MTEAKSSELHDRRCRRDRSRWRPTITQPLRVRWKSAPSASPVVYTLGSSPRANRIAEVTPSGIWVETERTLTRDIGAQVVAPRMLDLAWDVLRARGTLTNRELLGELRIHRSSNASAILARLPGVTVTSTRPIELMYRA